MVLWARISRLASPKSSVSGLVRNMSSETVPGSQPKEADVEFDIINDRGIITLSRPKSLNAVNLSMVKQIKDKLLEWENRLKVVIIRGKGRAFCAGGDIISVTKGGPQSPGAGKEFFRTEYGMNHIIGTYKIPYVALIDGITMGGGVGLSVHGKYRVATEKTVFAMPETGIGLFPDVGGTYFLPRLRGKLGLFLALTGHRLNGLDLLHAGIATHFLDSSKVDVLYEDLLERNPDDVLARCCPRLDSPAFSLDPHLTDIDLAFSQPTIEQIFSTLDSMKTPWAQSTLKTLAKMSPTSLKLTKVALEKGATMSLFDALYMENRIAAHVLEGKQSKDFYEGVRALLVDKDKNPKWSPGTIQEVTDDMILKYFQPLPSDEELVI